MIYVLKHDNENLVETDYVVIADLVNETTKLSFVGHYHPAVVSAKVSASVDSIAERVNQGTYFTVKDSDTKVIGVISLIDGELQTFFVDVNYQWQRIG